MAEKEKQTASPAPAAEHGRLEEAALAIFSDATRNARGFDPAKVAHDAFRKAKAFLDTSSAIASGELSAETEKPLPYEEIEVPVLVQTTDEKWEPVLDPHTRKPVTEKLAVDRFAYAPNLPADHPINLRFKPQDGRSIKERHIPEHAMN